MQTYKKYISSTELAALVGISVRKATQALICCHNGKTWRGSNLVVLKIMGNTGRGGFSYVVDRDSIPPEFIKAKDGVQDSASDNVALPIAEPTQTDKEASIGEALTPIMPPKLRRKSRHYKDEEVNFKIDTVQRVLHATNHNTPERATLISELAATLRYPYGAKRGQPVGENTIRNWLKGYEDSGLGAVCRKARTDSGQKRVMVSRLWDKTAKQLGITDDERQRMADELKRHVASLWRSGTPSVPTVQLNVLPFATDQFKQAGCTLSKEALLAVCKLPPKLIQSQAHFKAAAIYRQDAARSAATQTPRIRRSRDHLKPMDWVAGDVHHIDIAFLRDDGSICTIKAVAWLDLATNRAYVTPFVMPKGEMIRREHVIESFVALCTDPNWGVPTRLYLDRGGEYNWGEFIEDLFKLKHGVEVISKEACDAEKAESGVHRSRAYNPQSKVIETLFGDLERTAFAQLPGYIGGNRMRKKVENQGKAPKPYQGGFEEFTASLQTALNYYHVKPKQGHLKGKSPNQSFQAFIDAGWKSLLLDPYELAVVFCKKEFREVRAGGVFQWNGEEYRHDRLISMAGIRKVSVGAPLFGDKSRLYLFTEEDEPIGIAEKVNLFVFGDMAGAGEQQRQAAIGRREMRAMEADTDKLDLEQVMGNVVGLMDSAPKAETLGVISIGSSPQQLAKAARDKPVPSSNDQSIEQRRKQMALREKAAQKARAAFG